MANPPRKKGTTEETAIVNEWNGYGFEYGNHPARRMPAGSRYDIHVDGLDGPHTVDVLMTRADRGERLVTMRFSDFMPLYSMATADWDTAPELHIESKRYARFALHSIFFNKFGRKK